MGEKGKEGLEELQDKALPGGAGGGVGWGRDYSSQKLGRGGVRRIQISMQAQPWNGYWREGGA